MSDQEIDWYAIRVCVREGAYMKLNITERRMATHLMRYKGLLPAEMAMILRVTPDMTERYSRDDPPIPVDEVLRQHPGIVGAIRKPHEPVRVRRVKQDALAVS